MLDQTALITISANNIFMAKEQGKTLTESEYLYMTACMDFLREVHRAKAIELRLYIERFEDEQLRKEYHKNEPESKKPETEKTDENGHEQGSEGDRV